VLPDNCLFEGKAGEVFEILMQDCNLHTVLRLPRGTFTPYSQGVKANVIFFQKGRPTEAVWIFDARSNVPGITKKDRPLTAQHFAEFEKCYGKDPNGLSKRADGGELGRLRRFHISEIKERGYKLDVTWLKDDSLEDADELPEPQDLAGQSVRRIERRGKFILIHLEHHALVIHLGMTGKLLFDSRAGSKPGDDYSNWRDVALTLHGVYGARTTDEA